jgi:hypothetical protein
MFEPKMPKESTMTKTKRNREDEEAKQPSTSPNPKDKKAPRSILKGKKGTEKDEKTKQQETKETSDEETITDTPSSQSKEIMNFDPNNPTKNRKELTNKNKKQQNGNKEADIKKAGRNEEVGKETPAVAAGKRDEEGKGTGHAGTDELSQNGQSKEEGQEVGDKGADKDKRNDKDNMEEDKYCLDLHGKGFKKHTSKWKAISEGIKNSIKEFTKEDTEYIGDMMEDVAKLMDKAVHKLDKDSWVKIFVETKHISAARNKKRTIRIFGASLAHSDPAELFETAIFDGNQLLETPIANAWAAAYTLYGPGWLQQKEVFDITPKAKAITTLYIECEQSAIDKVIPFRAADVYEDSPESLHNIEIKMRKVLEVRSKGKEVIKPQVWADAMTKKFQDPLVKQACLRLAKTSSNIFHELKVLKGSKLDKISVTSIWMGANQILGHIGGPKESKETRNEAVGNRHNQQTKATQQAGISDKTAVKFTADTKDPQQKGTKLCISKSKPQMTQKTTLNSKRKYKGYYKAKTTSNSQPVWTKGGRGSD